MLQAAPFTRPASCGDVGLRPRDATQSFHLESPKAPLRHTQTAKDSCGSPPATQADAFSAFPPNPRFLAEEAGVHSSTALLYDARSTRAMPCTGHSQSKQPKSLPRTKPPEFEAGEVNPPAAAQRACLVPFGDPADAAFAEVTAPVPGTCRQRRFCTSKTRQACPPRAFLHFNTSLDSSLLLCRARLAQR